MNDRLFIMMGLMMVSSFVFIMVLPDPYSTIASLGTNLAMLFYLRKNFRNLATNMFGGKLKYQCLICQGTKFDGSGICHRCGGRSKKPI